MKNLYTYKIQDILKGFRNIDEINKPSDIKQYGYNLRKLIANDLNISEDEVRDGINNNKIKVKCRGRKVLVKVNV